MGQYIQADADTQITISQQNPPNWRIYLAEIIAVNIRERLKFLFLFFLKKDISNSLYSFKTSETTICR